MQLGQIVALQVKLLDGEICKDSTWKRGKVIVLKVHLLDFETFKDSPGQCLQLVLRDVKDAVDAAVGKFETSETLSMQLSQIVALQVKLLHFETLEDSSWKRGKVIVLKVQLLDFKTKKDVWRQCLQLVSGHIQDAIIQLEAFEAVRMQLGQIVALQVQLLDGETCKDSSWKCGQAVAFQVQFTYPRQLSDWTRLKDPRGKDCQPVVAEVHSLRVPFMFRMFNLEKITKESVWQLCQMIST